MSDDTITDEDLKVVAKLARIFDAKLNDTMQIMKEDNNVNLLELLHKNFSINDLSAEEMKKVVDDIFFFTEWYHTGILIQHTITMAIKAKTASSPKRDFKAMFGIDDSDSGPLNKIRKH